jgi:hypothetical protein
MRNPFEKERHNGLIAGLIIGSVAAATVSYLMLTGKGAVIRRDLADTFARLQNTVFGSHQQEEEEDHAKDYLQKPHKTPKTDREALLKHQILAEDGGAHTEE